MFLGTALHCCFPLIQNNALSIGSLPSDLLIEHLQLNGEQTCTPQSIHHRSTAPCGKRFQASTQVSQESYNIADEII